MVLWRRPSLRLTLGGGRGRLGVGGGRGRAVPARARAAVFLWRRPSLRLTLGVGLGRLRIGRAQGLLAQGTVTTRARTIQRMPLAETDRCLLAARGCRW